MRRIKKHSVRRKLAGIFLLLAFLSGVALSAAPARTTAGETAGTEAAPAPTRATSRKSAAASNDGMEKKDFSVGLAASQISAGGLRLGWRLGDGWLRTTFFGYFIGSESDSEGELNGGLEYQWDLFRTGDWSGNQTLFRMYSAVGAGMQYNRDTAAGEFDGQFTGGTQHFYRTGFAFGGEVILNLLGVRTGIHLEGGMRYIRALTGRIEPLGSGDFATYAFEPCGGIGFDLYF